MVSGAIQFLKVIASLDDALLNLPVVLPSIVIGLVILEPSRILAVVGVPVKAATFIVVIEETTLAILIALSKVA